MIHYIDTGPLPIYLGFTRSERAFKAEMRRLGVSEHGEFIKHGYGGRTHAFEHPKHGTVVIVCMGPTNGHKTVSVHGLLVHEAMHVYQHLLETMRCASPGGEFEAYTVQFLAQRLFEAADHG
jgi:hypothetical protein